MDFDPLQEFPFPSPPPAPPPVPAPCIRYVVYQVASGKDPLHVWEAPISQDDIKCNISKWFGSGFYWLHTVEGGQAISKQQISIFKNDKKCPVKGHCSI